MICPQPALDKTMLIVAEILSKAGGALALLNPYFALKAGFDLA